MIAKLKAALSEPLACLKQVDGGNNTAVGASIGTALYPQDGNDAESLIKNSDQRMYQEKTVSRGLNNK